MSVFHSAFSPAFAVGRVKNCELALLSDLLTKGKYCDLNFKSTVFCI